MVSKNEFIAGIDKAVGNRTRAMTAKNLKSGVILGEISTVEYIEVNKLIKNIEQYDLLVGIPAETAGRKSGELNNAELAFLQTHGVTNSQARQKIQEQIDKGMNYKGAREKVHALWLIEHGSPAWRVPPRPIIEPAIKSKSENITQMLGDSLKLFLAGDFAKGERKLKSTGMYAQNVVREWFTNSENNWAPNAASTIKAKGSDRPLIDTGDLRKSITYVIKTPTSRYVGVKKKKNSKVDASKVKEGE